MASNKQFAALPFRIRGSELDVLLITTRRKRRWSLPKGWPIDAAKPHRTAEIEAFERGWPGRQGQGKTRGPLQASQGEGQAHGPVCDISVFPLKVRKQKKSWPEREQRDAIWLPARKAAACVHTAELSRVIERFVHQKLSELKLGAGKK